MCQGIVDPVGPLLTGTVGRLWLTATMDLLRTDSTVSKTR